MMMVKIISNNITVQAKIVLILLLKTKYPKYKKWCWKDLEMAQVRFKLVSPAWPRTSTCRSTCSDCSAKAWGNSVFFPDMLHRCVICSHINNQAQTSGTLKNLPKALCLSDSAVAELAEQHRNAIELAVYPAASCCSVRLISLVCYSSTLRLGTLRCSTGPRRSALLFYSYLLETLPHWRLKLWSNSQPQLYVVFSAPCEGNICKSSMHILHCTYWTHTYNTLPYNLYISTYPY